METLNTVLEHLKINPAIVLIVIASGFFQQRYLNAIKWPGAIKTLLVSSIVVTIMLILTEAKKADLWPAFSSYFAATSFYELLIVPVVSIFKKLPGNETTFEKPSAPGDEQIKNQ